MPEKYIPTNPNEGSNLRWYKKQTTEDLDQMIGEFQSIITILEDIKNHSLYDYDEADVEHLLEALDEFAVETKLDNMKDVLVEYINYFLNR